MAVFALVFLFGRFVSTGSIRSSAIPDPLHLPPFVPPLLFHINYLLTSAYCTTCSRASSSECLILELHIVQLRHLQVPSSHVGKKMKDQRDRNVQNSVQTNRRTYHCIALLDVRYQEFGLFVAAATVKSNTAAISDIYHPERALQSHYLLSNT